MSRISEVRDNSVNAREAVFKFYKSTIDLGSNEVIKKGRSLFSKAQKINKEILELLEGLE